MVRGLIELPSIDEAWYKTTTRFIHHFAIDYLQFGRTSYQCVYIQQHYKFNRGSYLINLVSV